MNKHRTVSILGCGWFGYPLAKELISAGYAVKGSTTSPGKMTKLQSEGIDAYLIDLDAEEIGFGNFLDSDILIIGIPPGMRSGKGDRYAEKIGRVAMQSRATAIKQVIFISSTSVFSDMNHVIEESEVPAPETASGLAILSAEKLLLDCSWFETTIVRFAGLIGPERDPGRFFAGKTDIANGRAPVNLIHQDDCIGIVMSIIQQEAFRNIFHGVLPEHPTRNEFYTAAASRSGHILPHFKDELLGWKIINSKKVPELLKYTFKKKLMT